jgi:hypothetical protein
MTNQQTKEILREMKAQSPLHRRVINEIVEDSEGYGYDGDNLQERLMGRLNDISHGLSSGTVGSMIYYNDTCAFFKRYKKDISALIKEYQDSTGESITDFSWFDKEDIFCADTHNQNYFAWFAYETVAWDLMSRLEE